MPSYVNIGAWVGSGTLGVSLGDRRVVRAGRCERARLRRRRVGGVLEPVQAEPVIVEDGAFIGSHGVVVEGVRVGSEAVLGAGVVLTANTPVIEA